MERERIHHMGSQPLNGNDAYAVLGEVLDWIEAQSDGTDETDLAALELLSRLRQLGYCMCTTEFGCAACKGQYNKKGSDK